MQLRTLFFSLSYNYLSLSYPSYPVFQIQFYPHSRCPFVAFRLIIMFVISAHVLCAVRIFHPVLLLNCVSLLLLTYPCYDLWTWRLFEILGNCKSCTVIMFAHVFFCMGLGTAMGNWWVFGIIMFNFCTCYQTVSPNYGLFHYLSLILIKKKNFCVF